MHILLCGGAGYIGTHTAIALIKAGHQVSILDNFCNANTEAIRRTEQLCGQKIPLFVADLCDSSAVDAAFSQGQFDGVIHFAGLKAVGESVSQPLRYYRNNIYGTLVLLETMARYGVKQLIFSSSATVYGNPEYLPIDEKAKIGGVTNPYGRTKLQIEEILTDLQHSDNQWQIVILRYFNPVGAHQSGQIGEDPIGPPANLVPFVSQVAVGMRPMVQVFGQDYATVDGTGVRDYLHVMDLAEGHTAALQRFGSGGGVDIYNLGTGRGYSVLEVIEAFSQAAGKAIPYRIVGRREGDIASCYADARKAKAELAWTATRDLATMCVDAWRWQSNNPRGYRA